MQHHQFKAQHLLYFILYYLSYTVTGDALVFHGAAFAFIHRLRFTYNIETHLVIIFDSPDFTSLCGRVEVNRVISISKSYWHYVGSAISDQGQMTDIRLSNNTIDLSPINNFFLSFSYMKWFEFIWHR